MASAVHREDPRHETVVRPKDFEGMTSISDELEQHRYEMVRAARIELKLPPWNDLDQFYRDAIKEPSFDIANERAAYILSGRSTYWMTDEWEWNLPF